MKSHTGFFFIILLPALFFSHISICQNTVYEDSIIDIEENIAIDSTLADSNSNKANTENLKKSGESNFNNLIKNNQPLLTIVLSAILIILFVLIFIIRKKYKNVKRKIIEIEGSTKEQEILNQKLFAQSLEIDQRNFEVEQYTKELEEKAKEQNILNQKLFAQSLEVDQRNIEIEQYTKELEEKGKEQEILNQKLFAQSLEVDQRNMEIKQYSIELEEKSKEQEILNQKLFAQSLEVDQRNQEIKVYANELETLKKVAENTLLNLNNSINYAKTIQGSLLPSEEKFKHFFKDNFFTYYKPKETIGGDFYFINQKDDFIIFAVGDCTGHGVPGALITMLGLVFLQDITEMESMDTTGKCLNLLRNKIKKTFKAFGDDEHNKNGMDIAICAINTKTNEMQYSGAFNPLVILRGEEVIEYKATRNPIGYYPVEMNFETHNIQLLNNDCIYLFSDGYIDQVGGYKKKKFLRKPFYQLLSEISKYPLVKQKEFIEKIMVKWIGNNSQVDDIAILGVQWKIDKKI